MMTVEQNIDIFRIIIDLLKTVIPFMALFGIFLLFKKELRTLIKNGGFKISAPGLTLETLQKQQEKLPTKEKKEITELNQELKNAKLIEQKLQQLQEYMTKDNEALFLGYHFERTYRLLFPSQMVILNAMYTHGEIISALAEALFRRTIWYQEFNLSFENFMGFMVQAGLVYFNETDQKFTLAPIGKTFWEYVLKEGIPLKIPANDVTDDNKQF